MRAIPDSGMRLRMSSVTSVGARAYERLVEIGLWESPLMVRRRLVLTRLCLSRSRETPTEGQPVPEGSYVPRLRVENVPRLGRARYRYGKSALGGMPHGSLRESN